MAQISGRTRLLGIVIAMLVIGGLGLRISTYQDQVAQSTFRNPRWIELEALRHEIVETQEAMARLVTVSAMESTDPGRVVQPATGLVRVVNSAGPFSDVDVALAEWLNEGVDSLRSDWFGDIPRAVDGGSIVVVRGRNPAAGHGRGVGRSWVARDEGLTCGVWLPEYLDEGKWVGVGRRAAFSRSRLLEDVGVVPCLLPAWFGDPGVEVGSWYAQIGLELAYQAEPNPFASAQLADQGPSMFGGRLKGPDVGLLRCAGDVSEACRDLVSGQEDPLATTRVDLGIAGISLTPKRRFPRELSGFGSLLFELLEERGAERFHAFWTSDEAVDVAFAAAYGLSMDHWMHEKVVERIGPMHRGPIPDSATWFMGILVAGVFLGGVRAVSHRRLLP